MHLLYYLPVSLFSLSIFHFFSLARILKWLLPSNDVTYKRFYCCDLSSNIIIILHISFKGETLVLLLFFLVILISYFKNPCVIVVAVVKIDSYQNTFYWFQNKFVLILYTVLQRYNLFLILFTEGVIYFYFEVSSEILLHKWGKITNNFAQLVIREISETWNYLESQF